MRMRTYRSASTVVPRFKAGDIVLARGRDRVLGKWRLPKAPIVISTRYRNLFLVEGMDGQGNGIIDLNEAVLIKQ
jgi:hypothetical protein